MMMREECTELHRCAHNEARTQLFLDLYFNFNFNFFFSDAVLTAGSSRAYSENLSGKAE